MTPSSFLPCIYETDLAYYFFRFSVTFVAFLYAIILLATALADANGDLLLA